MKIRIIRALLFFVLLLALTGCDLFNFIPGMNVEEEQITFTLRIDGSDIPVSLSKGSTLSFEDLIDVIPFGYGIESFIVDGQSIGKTLTIDESLSQKIITLELSELNLYTVTVVYVFINSTDQLDPIVIEIPEGHKLKYFEEIYDLKYYYHVKEYFTNEALTQSFDSESLIDQPSTIYITIEKDPTYIITLISNSGESYFVENTYDSITNPVGYLSQGFADELKLPYEKKVEGIYVDQTMTTAVERLTFDADKTLYINIVDKEIYHLTFDCGYDRVIYELLEGEEMSLQDYKLHEKLRSDLSITSIQPFVYFYSDRDRTQILPEYIEPRNQTIYLWVRSQTISANLLFFYQGTIIKEERYNLMLGENYDSSLSGYMYENLYGYEIDQISNTSNFTRAYDVFDFYFGDFQTVCIELKEIPKYHITIHVSDPFDYEITVYEFDINQTSSVWDYQKIMSDLYIERFYLDSQMTVSLESGIIDEDTTLYAEGYINEMITVTFVYPSEINPVTISYSPLEKDFDPMLIYSPIYELEGEYVYNIQFWLDAEHTIPCGFLSGNFPNKDTTLYVTYLVEDPS